MATQETTTDGNARDVPVACALTTADLAAQSGRWQRLAARAMIERAETAEGLRICFRPESGVAEELRQLVAVENECCRWARWMVETESGQIVVDVRSTGEGIAALHGMFTSLESVPVSCCDAERA